MSIKSTNTKGYVQHDDSRFTDASTYNEQFAQFRNEQLRNEYNEDIGFYDPSGIVSRIGLDPAQYMKDRIRLQGLGTVVLTPDAHITHNNPDRNINAGDSNQVASYLEQIIKPNINWWQNQRARHNMTYALQQYKNKLNEQNAWLRDKVDQKRLDSAVDKEVLDKKKTAEFIFNQGVQGVLGASIDLPGMNTIRTYIKSPSTLVHETHHNLDYGKTGFRSRTNMSLGDLLGDESYNDMDTYDKNMKYLYSDKEMEARAKQVQFDNKLSPSHKYTRQDYDAMKKDSTFKWHNLNQVTPEHFLELLNKVF